MQLSWYPLIGEWIKKFGIHTQWIYSSMKKKEIMSLAGKWTEMEIITLSEINQI
jgi:hypothetical protein